MCIAWQVSLKPRVGELTEKTVTSLEFVWRQQKESMEGLCCGSEGGTMSFSPDWAVAKEATLQGERMPD